MTVHKKSYFISKQHSAARANAMLLIERLMDEGWVQTMMKITQMHIFEEDGQRIILGRSVEQSMKSTSQRMYTVNDRHVTVGQYLEQEDLMDDADVTFLGEAVVSTSKFRKAGTNHYVELLATLSGVYSIAQGDSNLHDMLAEYYVECDEPDVLYVAKNSSGDLFLFLEDPDGLDYNED